MTPENIRIQGDVDLFPPNLKNFVATVVLREQALADRSRLIAACKGVVEQRHRCNAIATLFGGPARRCRSGKLWRASQRTPVPATRIYLQRETFG